MRLDGCSGLPSMPRSSQLAAQGPSETLLTLLSGAGVGVLVGLESGSGEQVFLRKNHSKRQKGSCV